MQEPSHLRAALHLALRALRARGSAGEAARGIPRRRIAVERQGLEVDPKRVAAYLRVVAGTSAEGGEGPGPRPLPPTYPALWTTALALELLGRAEVPVPTRGMIHLESERLLLRPLYADDRPRCRVELDRVDDHPKGLRLTLVSRVWSPGGQLCLQDAAVLLARFADEAGAPPSDRAEDRAEEPPAGWREVQRWELGADLGRRYARVSGDFNPIHLWSWSSRPFGFRRPILHGYCTEAMVAHALTQRLLGADPCALRRLRIRFRAPLLLPARVRLEVAPHDSASGGVFRLVGEEAGERPLAEGEFVGRIQGDKTGEPA